MWKSICCAILLASLIQATSLLACAPQDRASTPETATPKYDDWLLVDGDQTKFKIRIEVFLPAGQPASDFTARLQQPDRNIDSNIEQTANRLTTVLAADLFGQYPSMVLSTFDGRFYKEVVFPRHDMRRLCAEGLKVTLEPRRSISIRVLDDGQPVSNARVFGRQSVMTNSNGVAIVNASPNDRRFSAIAPDGKVGILRFSDLTPEQIRKDEFQIDITNGVRQTIRAIDDNGNPVPDVMIMPQSRDRSIELIPTKGFPITLDDRGETEVTWLPNLPTSPRASIRVVGKTWQALGDEKTPDVWTVKLKRLVRKQITGRVELPAGVKGGFQVRLTSFDHPTDRRVDQLYTTTDDQGNFVANVLPGAVYCAFAIDSRWSSSFWDGVIVKEDGTAQQPVITLSPGLPIRIVATQGPGESPMANTSISVSRSHGFRTKDASGNARAEWPVETDENGVAVAFASPGRLDVSIRNSNFNDRKTIKVEEGSKNEVKFHRKNVDSQSISGKLNPPAGSSVSTAGANVFVEASDGKFHFSSKITASNQGEFELQGMGDRFAVLAMTADKKAAGFSFCDVKGAGDLSIDLAPTLPYRGLVLDQDGQPLADCKVVMTVRLTDSLGKDLRFSAVTKTMTELNSTTGSNGQIEFPTTPVGVSLVLRIDDARVKDAAQRYLGERMLLPEDDRPRETFRLGLTSQYNAKTIVKWLEELQLDCKAADANRLVIIAGDDQPGTAKFVRSKLLDVQDTKDILWYLPAWISHEKSQLDESRQLFASLKWPTPSNGQIAIIATAPNGNEIGRMILDVTDESSAQLASEFLREHKGAAVDAKQKLDSALKLARQSNRKVWAITGNTRCTPCLRFARWIESQREILEKDYLFLKVDAYRHENALEIKKLITSGKNQGVPFYAILDHDGAVLIDSEGPLGNIGYVSTHEGAQHFRQMLTETANSLTETEINELVNSLGK
ncbi:MAG: thioredoxin family protein [Planctomycetota bacterium]